MSVQFIIGRAGSGKSQYCLQQIERQLAASPQGKPIILIVPEQATFQAEYAIVTAPGLKGSLRAQVLSFQRLAYRVLQETGGLAKPPMDETGKKLLLYKIMLQLKDQLRPFAQNAEQIGFIEHLLELFDELKRYGITPQQLLQKSRKGFKQGLLADKLKDVCLIYESYERLMFSQYTDSEDMLDRTAEHILQSRQLADADIWIDGFNGFTPQELQVIASLLQRSQHVHISLCVDREYKAEDEPHELDLFYAPAKTMVELQSMVDGLNIARLSTLKLTTHSTFESAEGERLSSSRFSESAELLHLEQHFEDRQVFTGHSSSPDEAIAVRPAVNRKAEVEAAAREILRLVRDDHYRWRDIAIMVRNIKDYHDILSASLNEHQIPFFMDQKRSVNHHPLVEFIRSALETVQYRWRYEDVFRCVKTDLLLPLSVQDTKSLQQARHRMDELENFVLAMGIYGHRWVDERSWEQLMQAELEQESEAVQDDANDPAMQQIRQTRDLVVGPLKQFEQELKQAQGIQQQIEALFALLENVQAADKLEHWSHQSIEAGDPEQAKEHAQIWDRVIDMFDHMVEVMGEEDSSTELFAALIETGLDSIKLGLVPPSLDQVLIGSIDRTRSSHIKVCLMLGINDGVIPQRPREGGILTENEREELEENGLQMAPSSRRKLLDEQFLIYSALATPSRRLWLSYPMADEEGKTLLPSEVIRRIKTIFPSLQEEVIAAEPAADQDVQQQLAFIARPGSTVSYLINRLREWLEGAQTDTVWWDAYHWLIEQDVWQLKMKRMIEALFFTNEEKRLSTETRTSLYGEELQASVSRMERFVACPFAQFVAYGLRLQERRVYKLQAPDIGQLFHAALRMIAVELQKEQLQWGDLTPQQCLERAYQVVELLSPRLQSQILLSSKRYHYIANKLKQIVGRASVVLGEHARRGHFVPVGLELDFGRHAPVPPLRFSLDNGFSMEIRGRIDRIDRAVGKDGTYLRVIDYKSSSTDLHLTEVLYGLSLQMLTYLDVAVTHAESWLGEKAKPAGVLYFHVHNPLLQKKNQVPQEEAEAEIFKRFKMKGLLLANQDVIEQMDQQLSQGRSDMLPVGVKKNGGFYAYSSVVSEQQWEQLRQHTRQMIRSIGQGITNGVVDIRPYRLGKETPCDFCAYRSICQFDPLYENNEYRHYFNRREDEIWQQLQAFNADIKKGGES